MKLRQKEDENKQTASIIELLRAAPGDFWLCLAFFTRLPVSVVFDRTAPLSRASQMFPVTGLVVGLIGSLTLALASMLQLPALAASILAVAAMIISTGALHEDGLADTVDGFGGSHDRERKLEIMKDSHIGTYGVLALILSQGLRVILIASLLPLGLSNTIAVLIAGQMVSRASSMLVWSVLPPARNNGLSRQVGQPDRRSLSIAWVITAIALLCLVLLGLHMFAVLVAAFASALVSYVMKGLCHRQIGGQTGDTIGATQQLCDLAFMTGILMSVGIAKELL